MVRKSKRSDTTPSQIDALQLWAEAKEIDILQVQAVAERKRELEAEFRAAALKATRAAITKTQGAAEVAIGLVPFGKWLTFESYRQKELKRPGAWFPVKVRAWEQLVTRLNDPAEGRQLRLTYDLLVAAGLPIWDWVCLSWDHRETQRRFHRTPMARLFDEGEQLPKQNPGRDAKKIIPVEHAGTAF